MKNWSIFSCYGLITGRNNKPTVPRVVNNNGIFEHLPKFSFLQRSRNGGKFHLDKLISHFYPNLRYCSWHMISLRVCKKGKLTYKRSGEGRRVFLPSTLSSTILSKGRESSYQWKWTIHQPSQCAYKLVIAQARISRSTFSTCIRICTKELKVVWQSNLERIDLELSMMFYRSRTTIFPSKLQISTVSLNCGNQCNS